MILLAVNEFFIDVMYVSAAPHTITLMAAFLRYCDGETQIQQHSMLDLNPGFRKTLQALL